MKMRIAALGAMIATLATSLPAAPQQAVAQSTVSGVDLARLCKKPADLVLDPCNSFILGAADGLSIGGEICPSIEGWTFIAPRVVRKYIDDNPSDLSGSAGIVVFRALTTKYPCPAKR